MLDDLELLARGNLIANAMYLPDLGGIKKKFRNTFVYLDTTFILLRQDSLDPTVRHRV